MGTRLYPDTNDRTKLETLASVSPGTYDRLDAIEARHKQEKVAATWSDYDDGYRQWSEINADVDLAKLHSFLLYGWGKFDSAGVATGCYGSLTDPAAIRRLFAANGINADPDYCEGVHWC